MTDNKIKQLVIHDRPLALVRQALNRLHLNHEVDKWRISYADPDDTRVNMRQVFIWTNQEVMPLVSLRSIQLTLEQADLLHKKWPHLYVTGTPSDNVVLSLYINREILIENKNPLKLNLNPLTHPQGTNR